MSDAIVGGIIYAILRDGRSYTRRRAELTTRTIINSLLPGGVVNERPSAVRPQQLRQPSRLANAPNLMTCCFLTRPTRSTAINAQVVSFASSRSGVQILSARPSGGRLTMASTTGLLVTNLGTEHGEIHKNNRDTVQQVGRLDVADVQL